MPATPTHKLAWSGSGAHASCDPEPGFRWIRFRLTYQGRADSVVSMARVPEGATLAEARAQIINGSLLNLDRVTLDILSVFSPAPP